MRLSVISGTGAYFPGLRYFLLADLRSLPSLRSCVTDPILALDILAVDPCGFPGLDSGQGESELNSLSFIYVFTLVDLLSFKEGPSLLHFPVFQWRTMRRAATDHGVGFPRGMVTRSLGEHSRGKWIGGPWSP